MNSVLVLCTGNSCRSQMAEGYLREFAGNRAEIFSAGIEAHGLNPLAVQSMNRDSVDISTQASTNVAEYAHKHFDYVITVCDHANEMCPIFPASSFRIHQNFPDPAKISGSKEEIEKGFDQVREMIKSFAIKFTDEILSLKDHY